MNIQRAISYFGATLAFGSPVALLFTIVFFFLLNLEVVQAFMGIMFFLTTVGLGAYILKYDFRKGETVNEEF